MKKGLYLKTAMENLTMKTGNVRSFSGLVEYHGDECRCKELTA